MHVYRLIPDALIDTCMCMCVYVCVYVCVTIGPSMITTPIWKDPTKTKQANFWRI